MSHLDSMRCATETIIFVTYVEADHECLKIWGQQDKQAATCVERYIYPLVDKFSQGYGCPSESNPPIIGALCCARFRTDGYYRAKILNIRRDGMIVVQFIDYGNVETLQSNDVHLLDNIPGAEHLQCYLPMATEFILLKVLPINGIWESKTIETIRNILCYNEYRAVINSVMNNRIILKLWYNNEDFCDILIRRHLALPATIQEMFRMRFFAQQDMSMYQQQNEGNMNTFGAVPMQPTNINQNASMQRLYHKTPASEGTQHKHVPQTSHPVQEALVFKSRVLDVASVHEVMVSCVEDGPQKFSVQVQSTTGILSNLMRNINSRPKKPLQEPPLPGSVCLGCYTKDKILCRAVVMSVMEHKCKLYYVDFGHTEVLPYTEIFQLPPEFINPKVLSIRFTLSGLKELNITQEMKDYFKELVTRKVLYLCVRPPEGPPLIQYGDLYENNVNVKDILKKAFPAPTAVPITYSYPQLRRLTKDVQEVVHVSFVESCKKFFVQLDSGAKSLESIMTGLAQYSKTASIFTIAQLKVGLPCAALYESEWYRAQILNVNGETVKVVYVDYGNEEILSSSSLRMIHDDLVKKLPAQAIKCALNGYEVLSQNQEVTSHFEKLTLEKRFYMKVVASQPNGLLVDLFEFETMRSIQPQLLNNIFCDKSRENSVSSQNEEVQPLPKTASNSQSGDKDKYTKKSNANAWNRTQNTKSFQENKSTNKLWKEKQTDATDDWSTEKQHDNRRERSTPYANRENQQNNRFTNKDESSNNRSARTYNKYDKTEISASKRGAIRGDRSRFSGNDSRYNRNNSTDKSWSDKDSDTSSKGSSKRGKSGFNRGGRGGKRDGRTSNKLDTPRWNDRNNDRPNYNKSGRSYGDYDAGGSKFGNKENETNYVPYNQTNHEESWQVNYKEPQSKVVANGELCFVPLDIVPGIVKNCEVVFINSPTDFFVQLNPDYLELESVMVKIAEAYENNGETVQAIDARCGMCCVAQYKEDLQWYRATILSLEGSNATVKFVDYGNTESVDFTKIKVIRKEFLRLPAQAVHCKLFGLTNTGNNKNENATFEEKIEGKSLEVEFITEENGMYEVLLREVVNGASKANSINEEFCTSGNLTKAKEIAVNKSVSNVTVKKINETPDYVPFNTKWQVTVYEPASKHDVIVTWFINPNKFYCQTLTNEAEFKTMMNEIQTTYNGREPVTQKLEIGSAVIAIFSEDEALYRAEIMGKTQMGYIVKYIDFGNCATVKPCNIYPVEKRFMRLPKLVTQCTLKNIVPYNNSSWSNVNNDALDSCFNADKYECTFHSVNDDIYVISLTYNGQDVSDMLVQKNLASFAAVETCNKIDTVAEATEFSDADKVEKVDVSLLSGQILKMKVSNVESTTRFHVQFPSAAKCEGIINEYMTDKDTEALALPGALAVMQNQALECSLQNVQSSPDANKQLKELIDGKEVIIYVEEVDNIKLVVQLYDLLGNEIMSTNENSKKISPVCPMPILSSTHKVCVSCVEDSSSIWLQRCVDYKLDTQLLTDLAQHYSNSGQRLKPEVHMLCAAKSSDNKWYRGRIISYTETTAYVEYIDYGNTEEVSLESIMALEPQFYTLHQLAVNASLSVTLAGTDDEQANILQTHLMNKVLMAVFYNVHKKWVVDLIENGEKISDKFSSLNLLKKEQAAPHNSLLHKQKVSATKFDTYIPYVDSPSQFWLQRMDSIAYLNENQTLLQLEAVNFPTIEDIPEEGTLCVAVYSIDDKWYRAEVLDADEDITTVRFIDYGNTDIINNKTGHIRQLPDNWKNINRFAIKCRLDVIPTDTEDWSQATCDRFENLVMSIDVLQAVIVADTMPRRVELFINNKSVSETLVEEKHAIIINAEQAEPVDEIVDLELDPHSAFVCHINSPNEFWVQEEESVTDLEVMTDRFIMADMFPKIDEVKEGLLCVAKYPEDEQWYRARVLSHNDNGTQVIYIDYGNSSLSTEIRALPEDLANIPPLSRKCCLELPPHIKEWSELACEKFNELAADGATIFILDVLKEGETSVVKLTLDKENVNDILANLCERHLPVIEERLPPLGEENSPNVVVSHINSPSEFWIQAESSISELEVMSDRLRDAQSFLTLSTYDIDTICAALYPEDECWYRAKIIGRREEGTEVLYLDYGNSAITEELRVLPQDIVDIPILSKRCALEKPLHVAAWNEEACERFKSLAAEGATMFQFETLDEEDPMHVRLSLNATNVVDLLLTQHEDTLELGAMTKGESTTCDIESQNEVFLNETDENHQPPNRDTSDFDKGDAEKEETHMTSCSDIEKLDEDPEITKPEYISVVSKDSEDTDVKSETAFDKYEPTAVLELSVDDIIESMVRDNTEDLDALIIDSVNSTIANESHSVIREDEQQNSPSQVQSVNISDLQPCLSANERQSESVVQENTDEQELHSQIKCKEEPLDAQIVESTNTNERISESAIKDTTEDSDSREILLSITNQIESQDIVQLDDQIEEKKAHSEVQLSEKESSVSFQHSTEISSNTSNLPEEEQTSLSQSQEPSATNGTINDNANKSDDCEVMLESTNKDNSSNSSPEAMCATIATASQSATKTDSPITRCPFLSSRSRSEDKIVPGCISRGESPDPEAAMCLLTPKIPCSEKLTTDNVKPLQSTIDSAEEKNDEIPLP